MASRVIASSLLLGSAATVLAGAVTSDVSLGGKPSHSVVLGAVAFVVAVVSRRLVSGAMSALPIVAAAIAAQPVLHLGVESLHPDAVLGHHSNRLMPGPVDEAVTAAVQIAVPALVVLAVAAVVRLAWLSIDAIRRPPAPLSVMPVPPRRVLLRLRLVPLGSMLQWCGWAILAGRRGPPVAAARAVH